MTSWKKLFVEPNEIDSPLELATDLNSLLEAITNATDNENNKHQENMPVAPPEVQIHQEQT